MSVPFSGDGVKTTEDESETLLRLEVSRPKQDQVQDGPSQGKDQRKSCNQAYVKIIIE